VRLTIRVAYELTALLALILLIAAASHGAPVSLPLRAGRADRLELIAIVTVVAVIAGAAALGLTFLIHRAIIYRRRSTPSFRTAFLRALPVTAVTISALSLMTIARIELELAGEVRIRVAQYVSAVSRTTQPGGITDRRQGVTARENNPDMDAVEFIIPPGMEPRQVLSRAARIIFAIIALALLVVFALRLRTSRRNRFGAAAEPDEAAVHEALLDTIGAMLTDAEPNTAIIGAYARLLENLEACGIGRLAHEAPREHLQRVLTAVAVRPAPLGELIGLFEIARFSSRRLTLADRDEALDALRVIAGDLAAALPPESQPETPLVAAAR
jgi:hypothetical protein